MPAVPKKRVSKARSRSRRAMWKLSSPAASQCPQCHQPRLPHHVCKNCGFYDGRKVIEVDQAENK